MSDEDRIERLLRLADPGPEIPSAGEARVKAALRPLWQQQVRRRSLRRLLVGASFAAAAAVLIFFLILPRHAAPQPTPPPLPVAQVELVRGPVDATLLRSPLFAGSRLHTSPGSRAALRFGDRTSLRLDSDTTVRLVSAHLVEVLSGAVYIDSGGLHTSPIEVRTRFGSVRDVGTRFEVRMEDRLLVRVREGRVDVATPARRFQVNAGFESKIDAAGSTEMSSIVPGESWSAAVAPPFSIEGRSVAALVDWCSQESGFAVRYHDAEAERLARTTLLHGSVSDLQPLEAMDVLLPTAGLKAIHGKGELVVRMDRNQR
ncbi:MAG TPA: FecR family protein [Vicinamibacterales bacterium]